MTIKRSAPYCALLAATLTMVPSVRAQAPAAPKVLTAEDLKAPSTPAATILGSTPTTIERPDTPRALVFNLASSVSEANGVPENYAVQIAPYWMRSHPGLLFDSYISPTISQSLLRSFSVSVATADWKSGTGSDAQDLGSRIALGTSAVILPGHVDPKLVEVRDELIKQDQNLIVLLHNRDNDPRLEGLVARLTDLRARLKTETDPIKLVELSRNLEDTQSTIDAISADWNQQIATAQQEIRTLTLRIQTMNVQRLGTRLVAAAAWSVQIPDDVFGDARGERTGFWVTPSYRARIMPANADDGARVRFLDALGVVRYIRDRVEDTTAWDVGGRVIWEASDSVSVSAETVRRWWSADSLNSNSLRAVGVFEVRLADKAYFFASFGRDFTEAELKRNLVSVVGLNLGFGEKPVIAIE